METPVEIPKIKKPRSEKQIAVTQKGMIALKERRERLAKEKEEAPVDLPKELAKKMRSTAIIDMRSPVVAPVVEPVVAPAPVVVEPEKKVKVKKPKDDSMKREIAALKEIMLSAKNTPSVAHVEVPVPKERVVSGSELLNKIFNL